MITGETIAFEGLGVAGIGVSIVAAAEMFVALPVQFFGQPVLEYHGCRQPIRHRLDDGLFNSRFRACENRGSIADKDGVKLIFQKPAQPCFGFGRIGIFLRRQ